MKTELSILFGITVTRDHSNPQIFLPGGRMTKVAPSHANNRGNLFRRATSKYRLDRTVDRKSVVFGWQKNMVDVSLGEGEAAPCPSHSHPVVVQRLYIPRVFFSRSFSSFGKFMLATGCYGTDKSLVGFERSRAV